MTYYDPLRARRRLSSLQPTPYIAGTGGPYMRMPEFPPLMSGQPLGAQPIPQFGTPRAVGFPPHVAAPNQQFAQQPFANQVPAQAGSIHGTSPAAQYMAATEAAGNQSGMAGGQPVTGPPGMFPPAAAYYNQQPANPYNPQGVPAMAAGGAAPIPGMGTQGIPPQGAQSYPGASSQYGYGNPPGMGDSHRDKKKKKKKSKVRRLLKQLLAGTAAATAGGHSHNKQNEGRETDPPAPPAERPPKGSALGFLHTQGHFVPSALDYMIEHFIHGNKERNLAPEGAKTGYLHPSGHFVPMNMERLIEEFKYTLLDRRRSHKRRHSPHNRSAPRSRDGHVSSSTDSESTDSDDSDTSSEHSRHRARSREGTY